jgi:hypothetical protein
MKINIKGIRTFFCSSTELADLSIDFSSPVAIVISGMNKTLIGKTGEQSLEAFFDYASAKGESFEVVFVSGMKGFPENIFKQTLKEIWDATRHRDLTLLVPYIPPPVNDYREDGAVTSFIVSSTLLNYDLLQRYCKDFSKLLYYIANSYLNSTCSRNIDIVQVGKPRIYNPIKTNRSDDMLKRSLLLIPHKGALSLLDRCMNHLNTIESLPRRINICFDDKGIRKFSKDAYPTIGGNVKLYLNEPVGSGPYLARHYSIEGADKEYIFFQDSDDIPTIDRFTVQLEEMNSRGLDMIGSHELRVDQFARCLLMIRFPLDANNAFEHYAYQPLFHPTALITRSAYLRTKGFSTDQTFGYDLQLTMRAKYSLKIGNTDDFLYIRFKRRGSLTTHKKTKIGSELRSFLWWRWRVDMRLVDEGKLNLEDSSLSRQDHRFPFRMIPFG